VTGCIHVDFGHGFQSDVVDERRLHLSNQGQPPGFVFRLASRLPRIARGRVKLLSGFVGRRAIYRILSVLIEFARLSLRRMRQLFGGLIRFSGCIFRFLLNIFGVNIGVLPIVLRAGG